jgi:hypothetical protein
MHPDGKKRADDDDGSKPRGVAGDPGVGGLLADPLDGAVEPGKRSGPKSGDTPETADRADD